MFEGLVSQLLTGYLGRYVKNIQKDQLKIGIWSEEVLLEDVELILEAFEYLQLPFALKHGRIGRLSIKIPWKKLGWDPIIIVLENVFISACQRDDCEWSSDVVEKREIAGKKAKLAAAELAKLSRRVCDNQAGQSFISYISARILDGIQVSVHNVHVIYTDRQNEQVQFITGLRLSSLKVTTDPRTKLQNVAGSYTGRFRGGQVNKVVEILGLGIYCDTFNETSNSLAIVNEDDSLNCHNKGSDSSNYDYILEPFDAMVSLTVNKSGKVEKGVPQYMIAADLTEVVILFNETQLQHILVLVDYLGTCVLREKYGRYRPWQYSLSRKEDGWQRVWWRYAVESVLSDVRKRIKKSSWSSFGQRIGYRHQYVNLYKTKLLCLFHDQPVSEVVLQQLEQMEKDSDVDDILNYRAIAELHLQDLLSNTTSSDTSANNLNAAQEKLDGDEIPLNRQKGWLNWLSLGMLGAGGNDYSSQFSGVISDAIVKDIYEATKFHPVADGDSSAMKDKLYLSLIKVHLQQILFKLRCEKYDREVAHTSLDGASIEGKMWEDSMTIITSVKSVEMIEACSRTLVFSSEKVDIVGNSSNQVPPFINIQVMSPADHDLQVSIKVALQPFEAVYNPNVLLDLFDIYQVWKCFQFQHDKVLASLNGFEDARMRLLSKAEYLFINGRKMSLNVDLNNFMIRIPWNRNLEACCAVLKLGALSLQSLPKGDTLALAKKDQTSCSFANIVNSALNDDMPLTYQLPDLYDHYRIDLTDFEMNLVMPDPPHAISVFEKFTAVLTLGASIFPDEPLLKQLEIFCVVQQPLVAHFSLLSCDLLVELAAFLDMTKGRSTLEEADAANAHYSLSLDLSHVLIRMCLDDVENSIFLNFSLEKIEMRYDQQESVEYLIFIKSLDVSTGSSMSESISRILSSCKNPSGVKCWDSSDRSKPSDNKSWGKLIDGCFLLHYQATGSSEIGQQSYTLSLDNIDFHCYPKVIGMLQEFFRKISELFKQLSASSSRSSFDSKLEVVDKNIKSEIELQSFGFSNYCESSSSLFAGISINNFPFLAACKSLPLGDLENFEKISVLQAERNHHMKSFNQILNGRRKSTFAKSSSRKSAPSKNLKTSELVCANLHLSGIRVHFHDASCILGTVTVPVSNSLVIFQGPDSWDLLLSIEGLLISSSWSIPPNHEFLFGPTSEDYSSIINLRVQNGNANELSPKMDICIGIQNVCCTLSADFLSILIGYFSMSDWTLDRNGQVIAEMLKDGKESPTFKLEIVDSFLIFPLEQNVCCFVELGLHYLCCNFILNSRSSDELKGIPKECMISASRMADKIDLYNLFGRKISLSVSIVTDKEQIFGQVTGNRVVCLISHLDADLWLRIPCNDESVCGSSRLPTAVMMRVENCQINAEDDVFLCGLEAVLDVANEISNVDRESRFYTADILQFKQLRKNFKEAQSACVSDSNSIETLTHIKILVKSLSIKLLQLETEIPRSSKLVAEAEIQLMLNASLRNDIPISLDVCLSGLHLYSFLSRVTLALLTCNEVATTRLSIYFSGEGGSKSELVFAIRSLEVWLHLSDWIELISLLSCYSKFSRTFMKTVQSEVSNLVPVLPKNHESELTASSPGNSLETFHLIVKSEEMTILLHFPVWMKGEAMEKFKEVDCFCGDKATLDGRDCKNITLALNSRKAELDICGENINLKTCFDNIRGMLEVVQNQSVRSIPFFQVSQVNVIGQLFEKQKLVHMYSDVLVETSEVFLSDQVLYFWCNVEFASSKEPSQIPFHAIEFKILMKKVSLLLTDRKLSCKGPLLEILVRNIVLYGNLHKDAVEVSLKGDLLVSYNNFHKVMWEPFIEPWLFQLQLNRKHDRNILANSPVVTDISLSSSAQLNLNFTEPLIESIFQVSEMLKRSWSQNSLKDLFDEEKMLAPEAIDSAYAPYVLQNDTSMPLIFWVSSGSSAAGIIDFRLLKEGIRVQPGSSFPIYIDETPGEQNFRRRPGHSSESLNEKKSSGVSHHMMSIQLEGTSQPSFPMSMDLVGVSYFEVSFSQSLDMSETDTNRDASRYVKTTEVCKRSSLSSGFVVPVVFEVSMQRHNKLIRIYSTVILFNDTSVPMELRFDIPLSVSPKVLDPIYPGMEIPLPVHLTRSGCMRLRPHAKGYLWSEAHSLSNILSQESRVGFLKSLVCYPSHPSSDLFRCCISIQDISLLSMNSRSHSSFRIQESGRASLDLSKSKKQFLYQVRLTTPLVVKNYLPKPLSLKVEVGGITYSESLPKMATASIFHVDSTHDLGIVLFLNGFKSIAVEFPRAEVFTLTAKLRESNFILLETLTLSPDGQNGPLMVKAEKVMDAFCGARELCISVPFLLYNCSGLPLMVSNSDINRKGEHFVLQPCYHFTDSKLVVEKSGLTLLSTNKRTSDSFKKSNKNILSIREPSVRSQLDLSRKVGNGGDFLENERCGKAKPYMFSPQDSSPVSELMVRLSAYDGGQNSSWSSPFFLVSPGGPTNVAIPKPQCSGAFLVSVTSSPVAGVLSGRTRAITFQPRFVISNACRKELWFRQKGTDKSYLLGVGEHSHLHWTDTTRDLLVSVQFNEPGWQWSGSFFPDHLGDAQVKMHHCVTGTVNMVRVEIQNANMSIGEEKIVGSSSGHSGTYLILLSDDNSGFMPYRIDNFSMERLRIYQQNCDTFSTTVHHHTSCPYAWDEPCYPHRLVVEVLGERVIGSYSFDDVRESIPICLRATAEKPERKLFLTIHSEDAIKVLSIVDSRIHVPKDMKTVGFPGFKEKKKTDSEETGLDITANVQVHLSSIGISLINSSPQELIFASAKDVKLEFLEGIDRQKCSFEVFSLQIDNQLRSGPYPVMLSFEHEHRGSSGIQLKMKEDWLKVKDGIRSSLLYEKVHEPVLYLTASKWRSKDISLVSFEYITLRLAPLCIELEEQVLSNIIDFSRSATLRLQSGIPRQSSYDVKVLENVANHFINIEDDVEIKSLQISKLPEKQNGRPILPSVLPIGAPWQKISLFAGRQKKIYVELLTLAPIKLTVSFSSTPWLLGNGHMAADSAILARGTAVQRGLMALVDVEGAPVYLKQLTLDHHLASWQSTQEILVRHYTRQLLHEMYKVFGSAGVIGNPMGFARNVGLGIKDFVSVPAKGVLQSPTGLIKGVALGTKSLVSNTVYAISNATTQFSKAAHKGIVAFTFDEQDVAKQRENLDTHTRGVLNEFLEGLTGLLQSPIKGAEKHGLPGVFSGIAMGTAGLVARPVASILEVTGKTAQSIRNRISPHQSNRHPARFPRPLARDLPLLPYCWEEAIGVSMLLEAEDRKFKDEIFVLCKALKQPGKFIIITEKLFVTFSSLSLVGFGSPEFCGIPDPEWVIEAEICLEGVVHIDREEEIVNIVGSNPENLPKQQQIRRDTIKTRRWGQSSSLPLSLTSVELLNKEEAEEVLETLWHTIEQGKKRHWGSKILHRTNLR